MQGERRVVSLGVTSGSVFVWSVVHYVFRPGGGDGAVVQTVVVLNIDERTRVRCSLFVYNVLCVEGIIASCVLAVLYCVCG